MTLSAVQGQTRAIDTLKAALRSSSIQHAYLFSGPDGVGKELAAYGFAQALLCEARPLEGCGECSVCLRVAKRNHPDVTLIMPEDEQVSRGIAGRSDFEGTPSREIRVDQVRRLQERLQLRPLEAKRKLAMVASAHQLNQQAQNAFLKTLEEPPPETVLILIASASDKLLPTLRSRLSVVTFAPLPEAMIAARVAKERKLDEQTAKLVAVLSGGSMSRALELDVKGLSRRKELIEQFEALTPTEAGGWLRFAEDFGQDRSDAEDALAVLQLWCRDLAVARAGSTSFVNRDLAELAEKRGQALSEVALHRRVELLQQASNAISNRNGQPRLQLERMLIEMAEVSS